MRPFLPWVVSVCLWSQTTVGDSISVESCTPRAGLGGDVLTVGQPASFACTVRIAADHGGEYRLKAVLESGEAKVVEELGVVASGLSSFEFSKLIPAGWKTPPELYFVLENDQGMMASSDRLAYARLQTSDVDLGALTELVGASLLLSKSPSGSRVRVERSFEPLALEVYDAFL